VQAQTPVPSPCLHHHGHDRTGQWPHQRPHPHYCHYCHHCQGPGSLLRHAARCQWPPRTTTSGQAHHPLSTLVTLQQRGRQAHPGPHPHPHHCPGPPLTAVMHCQGGGWPPPGCCPGSGETAGRQQPRSGVRLGQRPLEEAGPCVAATRWGGHPSQGLCVGPPDGHRHTSTPRPHQMGRERGPGRQVTPGTSPLQLNNTKTAVTEDSAAICSWRWVVWGCCGRADVGSVGGLVVVACQVCSSRCPRVNVCG
jgi:hypothetical protein